jgi:hypothetical protein
MDTNGKPQVSVYTLLEHKTQIKQLIPSVGIKPVSHNFISFELRMISEKYGKDVMYETIVELGLDKIGWEAHQATPDALDELFEG